MCAESERQPLTPFVVSKQTSMPRIPIHHIQLTNVSIQRNQATNCLLSPSDIPNVHPWQPGLKEAQRFSLTAVSLRLVLLEAGLAACGLCLGEEGELQSQHNVVQPKTQAWSFCWISKNVTSLINEPSHFYPV